MRLARLTVNLCTALLMMTATGNAEDQTEKQNKSTRRGQQSQRKDDRNTNRKGEEPGDRAANEAEQLPEFLSRLDLTDQQKSEIQNVMHEHDEMLADVWSQFHALHWNAIEFEATLAAARNLATHDHSAHHQADVTKTEKAEKGDKQQAEKSSPASRDRRQAATPNENSESNESARGYRGGQHDEDADDDQANVEIIGLQIAVLEPTGTVRQIRLKGNSEKGHSECEVCHAHQTQLDALWKKMYQLHEKLVQIEADRMVAIESKLNEDQLQQLQEMVAAENEQPQDDRAADSNNKQRKE